MGIAVFVSEPKDLAALHVIKISARHWRKPLLVRVIVCYPEMPAPDDIRSNLDGDQGVPFHAGFDLDFEIRVLCRFGRIIAGPRVLDQKIRIVA